MGNNSLYSGLSTSACNDTINLSLDLNCEAIIIPDLVLEAPDLGNKFRIFITEPKDSVGNYSNNGTDSVKILKTGIYTYAIIDSLGRFCGGSIIAEDKLAPTFSSLPRDTIVNCQFNLTKEGIGATPVTAMDNCSMVTVSFESAFIESGNAPCDTSVIASLWKAVDAFGNLVIDTQRTIFIRPTVNQLIAPEDIILSCGEDSTSAINDFTKTGFPKLQIGKIINAAFMPTDTITLDGEANNCTLGISHRDIIENVDCEIKITRFWEAIDWCLSSSISSTIDTQFIQYVDTLAPVFEMPTHGSLQNPQSIALNKACQFATGLILPTATDNCDTLPQVESFEVAQLVNGIYTNIGTNLQAITLSADTFRIGYRAFDNCTNQLKEDTTYTYLIAADVIAPAVICASDLVIAIANNQGAILEAETVDGGSFDACGKISKAIRKKGDTTWQTAIVLPCELIDSQLVVELRITDAVGNENFCWTTVTLEDKVSPNCQNLPNDTTICAIIKANDFGQSTDINNNEAFDESEWRNMTSNQMLNYNETFGLPPCLDNIDCKFFTVEQQYQRLENGCGMARIQRRYRGIDAQENIGTWSTQQLVVNYQADWTVTFAPDWEGDCRDVIPIPFIQLRNGACDNLNISITENAFEAEDDFCLKVERIYQIINPCLLTTSTIPLTIIRSEDSAGRVKDSLTISSDSLGANAHLLYKQILKIRSTEKPTLVIEDVATCLEGTHIDSLNIKTDSINNCAENRTFSANGQDCLGNDITQFQWNFYEDEQLTARGTGNTFTKAVEPNIDYSVQFIAIDACNNQAVERKDFAFTDCAKPTLFTRTGITLGLTKKSIEIWANDFDKGSSDNCTDKATLLDNFRIWHPKLGFEYPEDIASIKALPKNLTFTCDELTTQEVFIYTFDGADNFDYVSAFTVIQDNQESCLELDWAMIAGQVVNEQGEQIEAVNLHISGDRTMDNQTDNSGRYLLELPKGKAYTIEPTKTDNPLNGITTFDLVLINKHILGITPFTSPYQYIAADVNKSGTITAFDLVQLRQVILNLIPDFPTNDSWRFVDSQYEFTTERPAEEAFTEKIVVNTLQVDQLNVDFVGIKIGDINGSARPNSLAIAAPRHTSKSLDFELENRWVRKGEIVEIPFAVDDLSEIEGLQFALDFKDLRVVDFKEGIAKGEHFNLEQLTAGQLKMSWHKTLDLTPQQPLFTLTLQVEKEGLLSELLRIIPHTLIPEAYTKANEIIDVSLKFTDAGIQDKFELFQNKPNPFYQETTIPFYLPKSGSVQLRILNLRGQVLKTMVGEYEKGFHEISINQQNLGAVGVLYYQLTAGEYFATKKMVLLN